MISVHHPTVTVLMPVYNGVAFLREAIDSVLNQTFNDFEFLIIDDASTDGSVALIESYTDPRIQLVRNEKNMGQVATLNKGLSLAKGKYIARLDQDDVCLPSRFQKQVTLLNKRPEIAVVGTLIQGMNEQGQAIDIRGMAVDDRVAFIAYLLLGDCPLGHPSVLFRREVAIESGSYDTSFAPAEDYELWCRLASQRQEAFVISEPLLRHRVHIYQQSQKKSSIQLEQLARAHQKFLSLFCAGEVSSLSFLLKRSHLFWKSCSTKDQKDFTFNELNTLLRNVRSFFGLNSTEYAKIEKIFYKRLGYGVKWGTKFVHCPSFLFYPLFFALSPQWALEAF